MSGELPLGSQYATCACGCGLRPPLATRTTRRTNTYQGEPLKVVPGHQGRLGARKLMAAARDGLPDPNPSGKCWCGCGGTTGIARQTDLKHGEYAGRHNRFLRGHQAKWEAKQRAIRKPQGRQLCTVCYQDRPAIAFLDSSSVCLVCVAKRRAAQPIWDQVDRRAEAAAQGRASRAREITAKSMAAGNYKRGPGLTLKRPVDNLFPKKKLL